MELNTGALEKMITLIWQSNRENSWENDWIEHLFRNVPHNTITDYTQSQVVNRSLIIYNSLVNNTEYIKKLAAQGISFGLIHLSDEWGRDDTGLYKYTDIVLRNYYKDLGPTVLNIPLGWMNGYPHDMVTKSTEDREYVWSFSGHVDKTTRPEMVKWMSTVSKGKSYFKKCGEDWGPFQGHALNPTQLADMYNNSIFVPCPQGNHSIDSFRVTEALQAGAIPIVERSPYWNNLFGNDCPFVQINEWADAPQLIQNLLDDCSAIDGLRTYVNKWWLDYTDKLSNRMIGLL